jgi:phosphoglycerol transferase MdoB-like AlkP superfamily enzyme
MLAEFYTLIPWQLYVATILTAGLQIFLVWHYNRTARLEVQKIGFNDSEINVIFITHRSFFQILLLVVIFLAINGTAFGATSYLRYNPRQIWFDVSNQVSDLGIFGHFYEQVYAKVTPEKEIEVKEPEPTVQRLVLTGDNYLENAEIAYAELNSVAGSKTPAVTVPVFAAKPNILAIQLESIGMWAIDNDPTPMPFLKQLMAENISVGEFHANSCETINAEFSAICGYWPNSFEPISYSHKENDYYCLPQILRDRYGYKSYFFHSDVPEFWSRNILIPKWGFDADYQVPFFRQKEYDGVVFEKTIDMMAKEKSPFYAYITTFTTHSPHNAEQVEYQKEKNKVDIVPIPAPHSESVWQAELNEDDASRYLGFLKLEDDALKALFDKLKETGLDKNTIVVIYNDHRFYSFPGEGNQPFLWYNEQPFVMVLPEKQQLKIRELSSLVDIPPTILNLVEGDDYEPQKNFIGTSLYSENFPETALNKCASQVYYRTKDFAIKGNAKRKLYNIDFTDTEINDAEKDNLLYLLNLTVENSDEALFKDQVNQVKEKTPLIE